MINFFLKIVSEFDNIEYLQGRDNTNAVWESILFWRYQILDAPPPPGSAPPGKKLLCRHCGRGIQRGVLRRAYENPIVSERKLRSRNGPMDIGVKPYTKPTHYPDEFGAWNESERRCPARHISLHVRRGRSKLKSVSSGTPQDAFAITKTNWQIAL